MELDDYILAHIEPEHPYLHSLWRATHLHLNYPRMASGHLQGQLLRMLVQMIRPRLVLEIGTYTGYSALAMASALEPGAMLHTIERNDEQEDFALPWIQRSPWADRIRLHIGDALDLLATPAAPVPGAFPPGPSGAFPPASLFDLVFIDADKRRYADFYRAVLPRVRPGGYIIADNTLWDGHVVEDYHATAGKVDQNDGIRAFNDLVAADTSVEKVIIPLRDGLTIIRKRTHPT